MLSLLSEQKDKLEYFRSLCEREHIPGSHDSEKEIRGELGYLMKQLKESNHNSPIVDELLLKIYDILKLEYSFKNFYKEYMIYLRLVADRQDKIDGSKGCWWGWCKLGEVPTLEKSKWNMWGSYKQFIFGKCVVDVLNHNSEYKLHPIWGCLLNPTGGIVGAGNQELVSRKWDSYISLHSCVHDSGGYLYNYEGLGIGYNYLNTYKTLFPSSSPMCCQYAGLKFWKNFS